MKKVLWAVLVVLVSVPVFSADSPAPTPPASLTGSRWVMKDSPSGLLLLDTRTGNVWVMKPDPANPSAGPHFVPVSVQAPAAASQPAQAVQPAPSSSSQDDSSPIRIKFSHGSNPKEYDPNSPNP